ncbi:MAG: MerR family transcriptional regulator [Gammaproteobacteria bacterium]|nr:MerR family transcriptional regulator [Gammaproteobacteria bacterium]
MATTGSKQELYGIGAVARLTGLTDHTIRVWERRYDAVVAQRAPNGRRVYDPADVEKLGLLKRLTDQGLSIGQIASDTTEELRERYRSLGEFDTEPLPDRVRVAILGDVLPNQFAAHQNDVAPVEVLVADTNSDRFAADLAGQTMDVVVLESPVLDSAVTARLAEYMNLAGAARGVIVYSFGRVRDIDATRQNRVVVLRSPVDVDEIRAAILRAYTPTTPAQRKDPHTTDTRADAWDFAGQLAPRRFNTSQLTKLLQASTAIDCECPHHLAQLVGDLTAFEIYSANCANRDDDDAALHRYLQQTTAQARAIVEVALARVAEAEGIDY